MLIRSLHYHVEVLGVGPPLLLLHGFTGSGAIWRPLVEDLGLRRPKWRSSFASQRPRDIEQTANTPHPTPNTSAQHSSIRLILVDLPGHGQSATPATAERCTLFEVVADLREILQTFDAVPADVLGYSMGGRLALALALEAPELVRRLIVESGSPGLERSDERAARRESDEALAARIERDGIERFVAEWEQLPLWESQRNLPDEVRMHQRALRLANRPAGLAASLRGMGTGAQPSYWQDLARLSVPTLLLTGALDAKFEAIARAMCVRNPAFRHLSIAGAGHTPHLEQPAAFINAVLGFLKQ